MRVKSSFALLALSLCATLPVLAGRTLDKARATELLVDPAVQIGNTVENGPNSLAIVWQAPDEDRNYTLRITQAGKSRNVKPTHKTIAVEGIDPHRFYTANLLKLKPGVQIDYELLRDGRSVFKSAVAAPKSDKQEYTFAVFGDCGIDSTEEAQIAYQTYQTKPDFVVLTGDMVYGRGRISEYRKNFYPYYTSELASSRNGAPLLSLSLVMGVPGNHDILDRKFERSADLLAYFFYWSQPLNGPIADLNSKSAGPLTGPKERTDAFLKNAGPNFPRMANYSVDYGNAHWTMLDANPYVDWNSAEMRDWLKKDLAAASKKTWRFVAFHQPGFHSSDIHQGEKQMRAVADIFEEGKVDVVFAGHVHNYQRSFPIQATGKVGASRAELAKDDWATDKSFDGVKNTKPKGVIYLVDGAGGAGLYNPDFEQKPEKWKPFQALYSGDFSFSHVTVTGKTFKLKQINKLGKQIDAMTITK